MKNFKFCYLVGTLSCSSLILSTTVAAQSLPNSIPFPNQPELNPPKPLPKLPSVIPKSKPPSIQVPLPPEAIPGKIVVKRFEVVGSTVFSSTELNRVLKPYTSRPISFIELLQAQTAVTQLYVARSYLTSGAYLPPQTIKNGVVKLKVVEGKIAEIKIRGTKRLNPNYIRDRLAVATKPPLNQTKLLTALQLLQLNPVIATISAELSTGVEPGTSFLQLDIVEADPFAVKLGFDNQRSPSVGSNRRILEVNHNNFFGWGDRFNVSYINTDGSDSLNNLSYTLPVNARNGTIELAYSLTNNEVIEQPFDTLDINTETNLWELTYRQPLYQTPQREFSAGLTVSRQHSETTLLGFPFPLSRGANNQGETTISAVRLFQEFSDRDETQVLALRSQFSLGVDAFDATTNRDAPDSNFFAWRGQAQYLRLLNRNLTLLLRSDLQLSDRALVPIEQFSLGGGLTVRGYRQDTLLADNGLFASAELRAALLNYPQSKTTLELVPFFDFGTAWNSDGTEVNPNTISSVGVGLRFVRGDSFNARLDWGIPLTKVDSIGNSLQEEGIHFAVEFVPF